MSTHHRQSKLFQASIKTVRACHSALRVAVLCALGFASALSVGCGELEPMREREVVELELTTDALKASVRDAQRMVGELRADLDARRQEVAGAQIARAQLEGRVREMERRIIEARQVIELQREELAAARTERAHVLQRSLQLQGQMKQLRKPLSRTRKSHPAHDGQDATSLSSSGAIHKGEEAMQVSAQRNQSSELPDGLQGAVIPTAVMPLPVSRESLSEVDRQRSPADRVWVKPGDTLWSIAQKYRLNVKYLRALNQLNSNRIVIGQTLWLSDDRSMLGIGTDVGTSTP